jgi:uncharacterized protein YjiS (DUF1127 family)
MSTTFAVTSIFPRHPSLLPPAGLHQRNSWRSVTTPWPLLQLWAARRSQRKTLDELAGDQHLLDDVGLTRAQASREAAKPFWLA